MYGGNKSEQVGEKYNLMRDSLHLLKFEFQDIETIILGHIRE